MSWEVLTMRSVTSFFNPALARSDLRRHWPILFLYTAIWLVALPVQLYLWHIAEGASYGTRTVSEVCQGTYSMGVIMAFVFGGVLAMALYSYLMNGRSVGLIHSLPLKRQTLFFTQLLTGFAMLTAGNLLVVLVSLLVCGEPGPLLIWLAVVTLAEIFFLALGTLCAMLTGWLLAVPVLYVGINFLVMVVMQLIHWLAELFIFGYQGDGFGSFTLWCTPVVQLVRRLTDPQGVVAEYVGYPVVSADVSPLENGGWQALGIYAAVAVAIIALACLLCIRRRSELSGDVAAFPWMRPVLRYGVGCIGGLALGMILYSVTFGLARSNDIRAYLPGMLLCVVLMTLVCSFGMSMLLGKSLKIFRRTWKGTVLLAALLAAVCVCVRMDVAGVERRVPKTDEIESVTAQCRNIQPFTATSGDTETIEAIRAIHRAREGDVACAVIPRKEPGFEEKVLTALRNYQIDMVVLAGFLGILSKDFIQAFHGPIINIHPSLIPSFCGKGFYGLRVHQAALDYGVKVTGATVHYVNEVPDGGKIILQRAVEILPDDTAEVLQRRVMEQAEWKLLPAAAELVAAELVRAAEE